MRYFKLSEDELRDLLKSAYLAWALEAGGVDNWEWAGDSVQDFIDDYNRTANFYCETIEDMVDNDINSYEEII